MKTIASAFITILMIGAFFTSVAISGNKMNSIYDFSVKNIDGKEVSLNQYKGKVLLIVNVASYCGYTKQYSGLENLYEKYKGKGFEILGFPCNQFGQQEPGTNEEIKQFCSTNYSVKFPLFDKIEVNGEHTNPLYVYLKAQAPGTLESSDIKWNFTKFLVDKDGKVLDRYVSQTTPEELDSIIAKMVK